ncbi:hypothetical protein Tcan_01720, partial [Toxocara canis]
MLTWPFCYRYFQKSRLCCERRSLPVQRRAVGIRMAHAKAAGKVGMVDPVFSSLLEKQITQSRFALSRICAGRSDPSSLVFLRILLSPIPQSPSSQAQPQTAPVSVPDRGSRCGLQSPREIMKLSVCLKKRLPRFPTWVFSSFLPKTDLLQ